jgi:hypothetical protein
MTDGQNLNHALADGFRRMVRESDVWKLFFRYQSQTERRGALWARRSIEEFDRLKSLRAELPNEPISKAQPKSPQPLEVVPNKPFIPQNNFVPRDPDPPAKPRGPAAPPSGAPLLVPPPPPRRAPQRCAAPRPASAAPPRPSGAPLFVPPPPPRRAPSGAPLLVPPLVALSPRAPLPVPIPQRLRGPRRHIVQ